MTAASPSPPDPTRPNSTQRRIRAAALLLAASSLLSRILGYGRDWLIAFEFGATGQTDVYQASFTLPDLINYLLAGGALSVSLLPRMAELYARQDANPQPAGAITDADRAFSKVCSAMMVAAALLIGAAWLLAEPMVAWWFPGFSPDKVQQTAHLTRIVLPAQLFFLVGGLVQAALLARQRFRAMALTPLLYNGGIIVGGLIGGQAGQIEGFSWGALAGAALGGLLVPVLSARDQLKFRFEFRLTDPEVRRFLWIAAPLMIGVSLTTVDEWLVKRYGSTLAPGSISWLMTARRVMLVPIGLLGTAAGQATGTYLARLHAEGKRDEFAKTLANSLAAVIGLSLVFTAALVPLARPVVEFLFQYGRFSPVDAAATAQALVPLSIGIAAWGAQQVVARAFYATGDTWRPMAATTLVTAAMVPVYAALASWHSHEIVGLCLAGTLGISLQVAVLSLLAKRRLGLDLAQLARGTGRALVVAALAGAATWAADQFIAQPAAAALAGAWTLRALPVVVVRAIPLAIAGAAWLAVFLAAGGLLNMPGIPRRFNALTGRLWRRLPLGSVRE